MKKKNVLNRAIATGLTLALALTGCGAGGAAGSAAASPATDASSAASATTETPAEPITLTFFDKNIGAEFTDPVAEEITKRTGVKIEIQQPTGNPEEKLALMLSGGDLPDIVLMDRRSDIVNKYIAAGALLPLNDLIDQYGPDIQTMYGDVLNKSRYMDGQNYYLNNWYGLDPDPDRGINMRLDILKELGYGDKVESGEPFTQSEFVELLKKFQEKYPEINGQPTTPFTINGEYMETVMSTFRGMYGMKNYYEDADHNISLSVRDPQYLNMVKFINSLYRDGLLDREWAVNKTDMFEQKLASGTVFACNGGMPNTANGLFITDEGADTDKQFYMFKVVADGVDPDKTTYSPRSSLGWDAIGITATNKHPEETIKFLNFLASEEGQYLLMWGVEGTNWTMQNGKHTPNEDVLPGFREDWSGYSEKTGIRKWNWTIKNGFGTDGTPYDLVGKYNPGKPMEHARISMANSVWDTAPYDSIGPLGGTPEALVEQKLNDIMDQGFSKMVYAASDAEVESAYAAMMAELEANDAASIEKIYTEKYKEQLSLWA
ncbi:MAG: extracellular solute-binding protein [Gemmiger sp.]|nr:extracellular solute-binding protein [Gemmiger sp.]